ncbi:hypothetical protein Ngar_c33140 [Candidatus Nitrososphaera gargensis Ga9.2]|uniref:Uncharacterized protein n=1 Tax=Nitrososphaera gargensis (strain Ga9.2) TaxID=1237085 RepID=K0INZ4_NITGG|nr:hypothetical protein [Candidatus Nitrososphaera gargensis]AFU60229.1 hypothetical protein Ngar_c33140 [Candidatus Nitrososphaera gargensis Ga9.2]
MRREDRKVTTLMVEKPDIEKIKTAIDQTLGEETSELVFRTLKLVYHIDEDTIVSNPELFRKKIKRMFGDQIVEMILKAISDNE